MATNYFQQANQLVREGKLDEAIALYQQAIAQNPKMYLYHNNLGETLEKLGRFEEAIFAYQKKDRDVAPFIKILEKLQNYKLCLKLHIL